MYIIKYVLVYLTFIYHIDDHVYSKKQTLPGC